MEDKKRRQKENQQPDPLREDLWGLAALLGGGLVLVALISSTAAGPVGEGLKRILRVALGDAAWGLGGVLIWLGIGLVWRHRGFSGARRWGGALVLLLLAAGAVHAWSLSAHLFPAGGWEAAGQGMGGGVLGYGVWLALTRAFGKLGAWLVGAGLGLGGLLALTDVTVRQLGRGLARMARLVGRAWAWQRRVLRRIFFVEAPGVPAEPEETSERLLAESAPSPFSGAGENGMAPGHREAGTASGVGVGVAAQEDTVPRASLAPVPSPAYLPGQAQTAGVEAPAPKGARIRRAGAPAGVEQLTLDAQLYQLPPVSLLFKGPRSRFPRNDREIADKARLIEETLASFGVQAKVVEVSRGPTVTRFEVHPGPGVKVSRITALADDIALSLAAPDVRIEPRIPGKAALGIEVPNREVAMVTLREVLETPEFANSSSPLTVAFGKDVAGRPLVLALESLLHLLIAGATGSGKSVCLNAIISSILFKARPHEVKFLLIDPKVVELSVFDGIPHLLAPVVADPKKATAVLRWVVEEMVRRWRLFAEAGVRDVGRYNQAMLKEENPSGCLPFMVVVIDELADLMSVAPVELEEAVQRLAQMGRAAGIHLVMATQRPSADVITGTIKANIPSRVAFAVASQVDSRIVLDMPGAERLVGRGDMLFLPLGASKPVRAQGAYISEEELEELVRYCASQARPEFDQRILDLKVVSTPQEAEDDLFPQAVRVVVETRQASASLLQRRLRVGYTRAARLIDMMEARGFISPYDGAKPREVFLTWEDYRRLFGREAASDEGWGE